MRNRHVVDIVRDLPLSLSIAPQRGRGGTEREDRVLGWVNGVPRDHVGAISSFVSRGEDVTAFYDAEGKPSECVRSKTDNALM